MKPEEKKRNVTIKLYPKTITRIEKAMELGYKKNTIIEKGVELYLNKVENEQKIIKEANV